MIRTERLLSRAIEQGDIIVAQQDELIAQNRAIVAAMSATTAALAAAEPQYRGVNLVGGGAQGPWTQWSGANVGTRSPGNGPQVTTDYLFVTTADVDYCISKGMNIFRLLFIHEAIQPEVGAAIPYAGGLTNASRYVTYYNTFKALVDYITVTKQCICLIDIHNAEGSFPTGWVAYYLRQFSMTPSGTQENGTTLADLWGRLATIFLGNSRVWFGIHNEPTVSAAQWYPVAQAVITAIRATGNTNRIVMPGINTDGARDWLSGSNHTAWLSLIDTANNMVAQVHNYYDPDNSGTAEILPNTTYEPDTLFGVPATATNLGQARLTGVTSWARTHGVKVFIGEFGLNYLKVDGVTDQTAQMTATFNNTVDFVNGNRDVIIGFTWWEYGSAGWAGNIFDLRKSGGVDNPRMNIVKGSFVP